MSRDLKYVFGWHLAIWVAYLAFKVFYEFSWVSVSTQYKEVESIILLQEALIAQLTTLPVKALFAYWLIFYLLSSSLNLTIRFVLFLLGLGVAIILYRIGIVYVTLPLAYHSNPETQSLFSIPTISAGLVDILLISGVLSSVELYKRSVASEAKTQRLEKEKIEAELLFLKSQTNPHFLLNTLNNLYALARKKSDKTAESIMKLSNLMKYVLYQTSKHYVPLRSEIEIIKDYISLEQLRYGKRLDVSINLEEMDPVYVIGPLLLLPLVENAFKHGVGETTEDPSIMISAKVENDILTFIIKNSIEWKTNPPQNDGIGLANLRRQLKLKYKSHVLETKEGDNTFYTHLELSLHEKNKMLDH